MPRRAKTHRPPGAIAAQQQSDAARARLLHRRLLNTQRYRRFQTALITSRPVCEDCGHVSSAHVHHVRKLADHPEDLLDEDQVKALCHSCHSIRTARGE